MPMKRYIGFTRVQRWRRSKRHFPGTTSGGKVDRTKLAARVLGDDCGAKQLEAIVHPLVRESERDFSLRRRRGGAGRRARHSAAVRDRRRAARRRGGGGVGAGRGAARAGAGASRHDGRAVCPILAAQVPDAEKRRRADFVVDTGQGFDAARAQVRDILASIARMPAKTDALANQRPVEEASMREIVIDTETTGLDPYQGHRLVEIGCIELLNRIPSGQTFHRYINPERDIPQKSLRFMASTTSG